MCVHLWLCYPWVQEMIWHVAFDGEEVRVTMPSLSDVENI